MLLMPMRSLDGRGFAGSSGPPCYGWAGLVIPMRQSFYFTLQRWCFFQPFQPGSSAEMLYTTPTILPIKPSTRLFPIQF